jgi:hypothetical protein
MTTPLRPMSTGELLDRTFNLYRKNFLLFVGIATVPPALMLLVNLIQAGMVAAPGHHKAVGVGLMAAGGIGMMVGAVAYLIGLAMAHAATVFAVSAVHLGRPTTINESYGRVKGRFGRVVWVIFQMGLRAFAPSVLLIILAAVAVPLGIKQIGGVAGALAGIIVVLAIIGAIIAATVLYLRYSLAVPACVLEDIKATAAIRRSVSLSAGSRGQIFVIYFLMIVINYIVLFLFLFPAGLLAGLVAKGSPSVSTLFTGLAGFLAGALAGPIATIALSLVYYDQRVRKEAFDIQLMMAALDGKPPVAGAQSAGVSAG